MTQVRSEKELGQGVTLIYILAWNVDRLVDVNPYAKSMRQRLWAPRLL